jgi:hypothetical protein
MTDITFECRDVSFTLTTDHSQSSYGNAVLVRNSDGAAFGARDEIELPSMLGPDSCTAANIVRGKYLDNSEHSGAWFDPGTGEHVPYHNAAKWSPDQLALARRFYRLDPEYRDAE